jgi:competence protein ComFC
MKKFAKEFIYDEPIASIAIDDHTRDGYSHTAILNQALKSTHISPQHSKLRAKSKVSYAGKTKEFRILNPRKFTLKNFKQKNTILVDDLITTGLTLTQAITTMQREKKEVLFCLTLADARG